MQQPGAAQSDDGAVIRIATSPIDSAAEPYYAEAMDFFKRAGLNVQVQSFSNGAAIAAGVASGAIDIGISNAIPLALAHERGVPFTILFPGAAYDPAEPTTQLMVAKGSSIHSAADLDGKIIATQGLKSLAQLAPEAWIDANGGDAKTVRFVEIAASALPTALEQGRVDAIVASEPAVAAAKSSARILVDPFRLLPKGFAINVWFASRQWTDAHPELVPKLRTAIRMTAEWANAHRAQSGAILEKYAKVSPETVRLMVRSHYGDQVNAALIQPNIDIAAKYGLLEKSFPAADFVYEPGTR
jgi:NitT/TauT family transport system substrate-binding protein